MMDKKAKILLAFPIAILLFGSGCFFIYKYGDRLGLNLVSKVAPAKEAKKEEPWQTYYGWPKGFEIQIPPAWSKNFEHDGPRPALKDKFWRDQIGEVEFLASATSTDPAKFKVTIKDSNLALSEVMEKVSIGRIEAPILADGLEMARSIDDQRAGEKPAYREMVVLKNGKRYFFFDFWAGSENIEAGIADWNKILPTFKLYIK